MMVFCNHHACFLLNFTQAANQSSCRKASRLDSMDKHQADLTAWKNIKQTWQCSASPTWQYDQRTSWRLNIKTSNHADLICSNISKTWQRVNDHHTFYTVWQWQYIPTSCRLVCRLDRKMWHQTDLKACSIIMQTGLQTWQKDVTSNRLESMFHYHADWLEDLTVWSDIKQFWLHKLTSCRLDKMIWLYILHNKIWHHTDTTKIWQCIDFQNRKEVEWKSKYGNISCMNILSAVSSESNLIQATAVQWVYISQWDYLQSLCAR